MKPWHATRVVQVWVEGAEMMHRILWSGSLALLLAMPGQSAWATEQPALPKRPAVGIAPPKRLPDMLESTPTPVGEPVAIASLPRATRRAVVADAARRFNVPESAVVLTRAEQVTWPDGSLNCPEPGRLYTQNLVPGYRLVAKTSEGELVYHADSRGNARTCSLYLKTPHEERRKPAPVEPETGPPPTTRDR
jgi:hypothetical protein